MAEEIRVKLPKPIYDALIKKAIEKKLEINDLLIRAIVAILEDKV